MVQTSASVPIYNSAVILILVVSVSAIFISFFGFCGAYKESRCILGTVRKLNNCFKIFIHIS